MVVIFGSRLGSKPTCHAFDSQKIIGIIFYGEADMGCGQVRIELFGFVGQLRYYDKDPQRGKQACLGFAEPAPGLCAQAAS